MKATILFACVSALFDPESYFVKQVRHENLKSALRYYTSEAHPAGSAADHKRAIFTQNQFKEAGLETWIREYEPLLTYPIHRELSLRQDGIEGTFRAALTEDIVEDDEASYDQQAVPTFLGYSANGSLSDVPVLYANFCGLEDFKLLEQAKVAIKGSLVLCRYGDAFRGLKVRAAELFGAAGVLIYSDPKEDGRNRGPVYPDGPWRPKSGVQRGSVQYSNFYAGDPLTPGIPATHDAPRINLSDANVPKIPALPISYADAFPFLQALEGHGVKAASLGDSWQGGLEVEYWTGPAAKATLKLTHEFQTKPIWNVMAMIPGKHEPDRAVVFGNHRDAWVYGAVDPNSGSAVLLETARIFGEMAKRGWQPDRTVIFASWDGEEYGLLGSTEWVEDQVKNLNKTLLAYINIDQGAYGRQFAAAATPSLQTLIRQVAKEVHDPVTGKVLYDVWFSENPDDDGLLPKIQPLGFGSDYVAFIHQIGVASMDVRFVGDYGVYHSNYDSMVWMEKYGDPGFLYHATLTQVTGKIALRLLQSAVLPFDFAPYAKALETYARDVKEALDRTDLPHSLDGLERAIQRFRASFPRQKSLLELQPDQDHFGKVRLLNDQLGFAERGFLDPKGIYGRSWYRHVIYAPGEWTGYEASLMPGIYEAIERGTGVQEAIDQVADSIERVVVFWQSREYWS
ncbi:hypothetical protein HDV03_005046 [Kappamyces sp. JEL0829]|nr:hypothetical protein HDV03_005046 [Kappamyces sp. JEL0829]